MGIVTTFDMSCGTPPHACAEAPEGCDAEPEVPEPLVSGTEWLQTGQDVETNGPKYPLHQVFSSVGLLRLYCKLSRQADELEKVLISAHTGRIQRLRKPAPARNELPADVVQAMIREYRRGVSTYQLAAWHEVRRNTVRDVLRRRGVQIVGGAVAKLSPEQKDTIRAKRVAGASMRALCAAFEVSESTIKRALQG